MKTNITPTEYIRKKALGMLGLIGSDISPNDRAERLTFINDEADIKLSRLREYNVWYSGDSDELLNFYTRSNAIDYNQNPIYNRNKRSYFWAVSSTESDVKRTHSGQPRNVVDTLNYVIGMPQVSLRAGPVAERLRKILDANSFERMLLQRARPFTMVEGWGAYKINYSRSFSDTPILLYYRADSVDFIYKTNRLVGIIYRDYYQDEKGKDYILFETRRREGANLVIEKELFRATPGVNVLQPCKLTDLPQLKDVDQRLTLTDYDGFLGCPSMVYEDPTGQFPGRSIFTGKIDLFDDLDQCLSQSSNTVRRTTPIEYFDTMYLEKDARTGLPKMPRSYDRKYVAFHGLRSGDGTNGGNAVTVTQPNLDFSQYSQEATSILLQIISGIMSPATLGIDIAKKDNAEAQREKEKVTIFTRNAWISEERKMLKLLFKELLCADELLRTNQITATDYDVDVKYSEFADASFEGKLRTILEGWQSGLISDRAAVDYLYGDSLSKEAKEYEMKFIQEQRDAQKQMPMDMGAFGDLGAENEYNDAHEKPEI